MRRLDPHNNDDYYQAHPRIPPTALPRENCDCTNCLSLRSRLRRDGNLAVQVGGYDDTFYPTYPLNPETQRHYLSDVKYPADINRTTEKRIADGKSTSLPFSQQPNKSEGLSISPQLTISWEVLCIVFLYILVIFIAYQQQQLSDQIKNILGMSVTK